MDMKSCPKCNTIVEDWAQICTNCKYEFIPPQKTRSIRSLIPNICLGLNLSLYILFLIYYKFAPHGEGWGGGFDVVMLMVFVSPLILIIGLIGIIVNLKMPKILTNNITYVTSIGLILSIVIVVLLMPLWVPIFSLTVYDCLKSVFK